MDSFRLSSPLLSFWKTPSSVVEKLGVTLAGTFCTSVSG